LTWTNLPLSEALYMCFDLETTGVNVAEDRIVQLAVSYFHQGRVVQQHTQLINPEMPIPEGASAVHGVYDNDVVHQPTFNEFISKLKPHLRGEVLSGYPPPILVGYNIISYDVPLFKHELARIGEDETLIDLPMIDLIYFARWHLRQHRSLKLTELCKHFNVPLDNAHNALFDAKACGMLLPLFYRSGYLADTLGEVMREQAKFRKQLGEEYENYRRWLYHDRFTSELTIGQGKHIGTPLHKADKGFLSYCLNNFEGIPELVQEAFRDHI